MKAEYLILGAGAVFALCVVGAAMLPDDLLQRTPPAPVLTAGPTNGPAMGVVQQGAVQPGAPLARNAAIQGLIPFTRAASQRFRGRIVSTVTLGSDMGWGQVHIWIADGANPVQELSLAPDWYLSYLGCPMTVNSQVDGIAFKFDQVQSNVELYAKIITINGKQCGLRNDEGFALWSNQLK